MDDVRKAIASFGLAPLLLLVLGLFVSSKYSKALVVLGALWGLANALFAVREVHATVDATGDPVISYPGADTSASGAL